MKNELAEIKKLLERINFKDASSKRTCFKAVVYTVTDYPGNLIGGE